MKFGCHISIRNGYLGAAEAARQIGADAFQYFPKNPRSLKIKDYDRKDARNCADFCREHGIVSIAHAPYTTNVSHPDPELRKQIMRSIRNDMEIVEDCGSIGLVVHFGSHKTAEPLEGYQLMIDTLNQVLGDWHGKSLILIENTAGKGSELGTCFEELVKVRQLCEVPNHVGFCFDTCHAFASGLWSGADWQEVIQKGKSLGYFDHLKAVHLNNSMYESGSRRDRHAPVHNGKIPVEEIKGLITSGFTDVPMILETPATASFTHQDQIEYIRELVQP